MKSSLTLNFNYIKTIAIMVIRLGLGLWLGLWLENLNYSEMEFYEMRFYQID